MSSGNRNFAFCPWLLGLITMTVINDSIRDWIGAFLMTVKRKIIYYTKP